MAYKHAYATMLPVDSSSLGTMAQVLAGVLIAAAIEARSFTAGAFKDFSKGAEQIDEDLNRLAARLERLDLSFLKEHSFKWLRVAPSLLGILCRPVAIVGTTFALSAVIFAILQGEPTNWLSDTFIFTSIIFGLAGIITPPLITMMLAFFRSSGIGVYIAMVIGFFYVTLLLLAFGLTVQFGFDRLSPLLPVVFPMHYHFHAV